MRVPATTVAMIFILLVVSISGCIDTSTTNAPEKNSEITSSSLNTSGTNLQILTWYSGGPIGQFDLSRYAAAGTKAPYNCSVTSGMPPSGFTVADCIISGKVSDLPEGTTEILQPPFTVQINDSSEPPVSESVDVVIRSVQNDMILNVKSQNVCTANEPCSAELVDSLTGGQEPYSFVLDSFANGAPPMGMTLNAQDGTLSGTPAKTGTYSFSLCAVDMTGVYQCKQASVTVGEQASVTEQTSAPAVNGATEPSATVDSVECTLVSKSDIQGVGIHTGEIVGTNYVFRLTGSGTVTGPVGTRVWVSSDMNDGGEFGGTYFSDYTASFTAGWTDTGQSSGYSPDQNKYDRGQDDPETTAWHFDGGEYSVQQNEFTGPFAGDAVHFTIFTQYYDGTVHGGRFRSSATSCSG